MTDELEAVLKSIADDDLAKAISTSYREVEDAFALSQWKSSGISVGHFVEAVRRLIELRLFGEYTPIKNSLRPLNSATLTTYEQGNGDDGYRIHIPRTLVSIYGLRNKRGYGHLSLDVANRVDVSFMLSSVQWVVAEVLRIESEYSIEETDRIVSKVTERRLPLIWNSGGVRRILKAGIGLKEQILILLYQAQKGESLDSMVKATEGKAPYVRRTLRNLHTRRFVEFDEPSGIIRLSPTGNKAAEELLLKHSS